MKKRLSIIVPIYNVEQYLEHCVMSLLDQNISKDEYEIILVNDGSTDDSLSIAEKIKSENVNIKLYTQENKGLSGARNLGLDVAEGDYIMFVDSDDMLIQNTIGQLLDIAEIHGLDICAYRMVRYEDNRIKKIDYVQPFRCNVIYSGEFVLLNKIHIGSACVNLYKRQLLEDNHLRFKEAIYHEDVEFNMRVYAYVKRIIFTDIVSYIYMYNPRSIQREIKKDKIIRHYASEFAVVESINNFSKNQFVRPLLKQFYVRHGNSVVVSYMIRLFRNSLLPREDKNKIINMAMNYNVYPIKGRTLSWKTTLIIPIVNLLGYIYKV